MASERVLAEPKHGWGADRLRVPGREVAAVAAFPVVPGEARRHAIFTLLFWMVLLPALAAALFVPDDQWQRFGRLPLAASTRQRA